jgi:hypothetical protein
VRRRASTSSCTAVHPGSRVSTSAEKPHRRQGPGMSWFCQVIVEPLPALAQFFKERRVGGCGRHVIDEAQAPAPGAGAARRRVVVEIGGR